VHPVGGLLSSGTSAHCVVGWMYNVSWQCIGLVVVSGHCVLVERFCSVICCWLVAIWMNVVHILVVVWLFFLIGTCPRYIQCQRPSFVVGVCAGSGSWIVVFDMLGSRHLLCFVFWPGSVRVTGNRCNLLLIRPRLMCVYSCVLQGCQPWLVSSCGGF